MAQFDKFYQYLSILLDKILSSVQQSTSVALIFLLCLHCCIPNNNENNNTNDNYSQLNQRRNENINVNNHHSAQGDSGQPQRQLDSLSFQPCLLSLTTS